MAPRTQPQQGQSFLVGGVCYDRNVGDMPVLVKVFRKLGL